MQVIAKLRHLRMSPRKVRLVADVIRGLDVLDAQKQLSFINKRATQPLLKLLNSAIANAENNSEHSGLKKDNLYIHELRVDEGPTLKRWVPRAMGRATPINKRTSHISIILEEKIKTEAKEEKKKKKDDEKIDKDVKIVKSLDEVKELEKEEIKKQEKLDKKESKGVKKEILDVRREGGGRRKQHLDAVRKKGKDGILKRMFRRKSI